MADALTTHFTFVTMLPRRYCYPYFIMVSKSKKFMAKFIWYSKEYICSLPLVPGRASQILGIP